VAFNDDQAPSALFGSVTFSNRYTGHPYGDFCSASRQQPRAPSLRFSFSGFAGRAISSSRMTLRSLQSFR
jgi:hypothetical protein